MHDLLLIGGATDDMLERMGARFRIHRLADADLSAIGNSVTHVATNGHDGVPANVMAACPDIKAVACYGVGYDAINTDACIEREILVSHTPDVLNAEVATTAVMLMLALYREMLRDDAYVRTGRWEKDGNAPLTRSADNRKVGILGLGRIGMAIAEKLKAFDAEICYHTRSPKDVPYRYYDNLVAMAHDVDVIICITPGGAATRHLVNRDVLDALGPEGTLINVSRGTVVDEAELVSALQDGRLGWAGLDVFEEEPKVPSALYEMSNVILLPHVGSATLETRKAMGDLVVDNLLSHLDTGKLVSPVPECRALNEA